MKFDKEKIIERLEAVVLAWDTRLEELNTHKDAAAMEARRDKWVRLLGRTRAAFTEYDIMLILQDLVGDTL